MLDLMQLNIITDWSSGNQDSVRLLQSSRRNFVSKAFGVFSSKSSYKPRKPHLAPLCGSFRQHFSPRSTRLRAGGKPEPIMVEVGIRGRYGNILHYIESKMKERKTELDLPKRLGITEEVYKILWREKRKQKRSMARIVNDLIIEEYGNATVRKVSREQNVIELVTIKK